MYRLDPSGFGIRDSLKTQDAREWDGSLDSNVRSSSLGEVPPLDPIKQESDKIDGRASWYHNDSFQQDPVPNGHFFSVGFMNGDGDRRPRARTTESLHTRSVGHGRSDEILLPSHIC